MTNAERLTTDRAVCTDNGPRAAVRRRDNVVAGVTRRPAIGLGVLSRRSCRTRAGGPRRRRPSTNAFHVVRSDRRDVIAPRRPEITGRPCPPLTSRHRDSQQQHRAHGPTATSSTTRTSWSPVSPVSPVPSRKPKTRNGKRVQASQPSFSYNARRRTSMHT